MNKFLAIAIVLLFPLGIISQCLTIKTEVFGIDNNHRSIDVRNPGSLYGQERATYERVRNAGNEDVLFSTGFLSDLWVGGLDPNGNLRITAHEFGLPRVNRFNLGPLNMNNPISAEDCQFYDRSWVIFGHEIALQIRRQNSGEVTISNTPESILLWPAKGNPYITQTEIVDDLAPYFDADSDGIYDPLKNDYPLVLEEESDFLPYQLAFSIYNGYMPGTGSVPMEFHQMNYMVNCSSSPEASNTIFTRLRYLYRGEEPLTDFRMGAHQVQELGCIGNEYIGCLPEANSSFIYNAFPENIFMNCDNSAPVPDDIAVQRSLVLLNAEMPFYGFYVSSSIADPPPQMGTPGVAQDFYYLMTGRWYDTTPLTVGNDGFNPGSNDSTLFAYPDLPTDPDGWSIEQHTQLTYPRYSITGLVARDLNPGDEGIIDFADYIEIDDSNLGLDIFNDYESSIALLKEQFDSFGSVNTCGSLQSICTQDCVWPGDVDDDGTVTGKDMVLLGNVLAFEPSNGFRRDVLSSEWAPWSGREWEELTLGIDGKYLDVTGNGEINTNDLGQAWDNILETRLDDDENFILEVDPGLVSLSTSYNKSIVDLEDLQPIPFFGTMVNINVALGERAALLDEPIHGISFEVRVDTNLVLLSRYSEVTDKFSFSESFIDGFQDMFLKIRGTNRLLVTMTNTGGETLDVGEMLGTIGIIVKEEGITSNPDSRDTVVTKFYNVFATNAVGEEIELGAVYDTLIIENLTFDPNTISSTEDELMELPFELYPNPASSQITLSFAEPFSGQVIINDMMGRVAQKYYIQNERLRELDVSKLEAGVYILNTKDERGERHAVRVVVQE